MDIASIIGILVALACMIYAVVDGGSSYEAFINGPSLACVFGGAAASLLLCFPIRSVLNLPRVIRKAFVNQLPDLRGKIELLVSLSETARRDGFLALEPRLPEIDDRFIKLGVQMTVDGARPEVVEDVLRTEMNAVASRHKDGKSLLDQIGKFCPAFGMIGTLFGLIVMLGQMTDPSSIGSGMAFALVTTLYGAIAANAFFLPLAEKLGYYNRSELVSMEVALRGILAIQAGENPRIIEHKLLLFLPPQSRPTMESTNKIAA